MSSTNVDIKIEWRVAICAHVIPTMLLLIFSDVGDDGYVNGGFG